MKETYDRKVTLFRFYEGHCCYLYNPLAKMGECIKLRRRWRGEFIIHKLSSHNVFFYKPKTNKYVEKSVHINKIKPCYQRDNVPKIDEVIKDIPIVEVTYQQIFPRTKTPPTTDLQTNKQQDPIQRTKIRTETRTEEIKLHQSQHQTRQQTTKAPWKHSKEQFLQLTKYRVTNTTMQ